MSNAIRDDFEEYMEKEARNRKIGLWVMAFTNVEGSGSHFIAAGPEAARIRPILKEFEELGYVSRKKQFVPGRERGSALMDRILEFV